jgi:hypothetical protein
MKTAALSKYERLRSLFDYVVFLVYYQTRLTKAFFVVDCLLIALGLVQLLNGEHAFNTRTIRTAGGLLAIAWPASRLLYGTLKLRRTIKQFRQLGDLKAQKRLSFPDGNRTVRLLELTPDDRQIQMQFVRENFGDGAVIRSLVVDNELAFGSHDWKCAINDVHRHQVRAAIRENREFCLSHITRMFEQSRAENIHFINESKWCLASELQLSADMIDVHKGRYFDSYCTNEACTTVLIDNHGNERSGFGLFPHVINTDGSANLLDLESAAVNNHAGLSTLVITSDHQFVVWQQGSRNIESPRHIVATASGSGDFGDVDLFSLRRTVKNGMVRELREEGLRRGVHYSNGAPEGTAVIGFFRWIARGGKPEFLGITRLPIKASEMQPDGREVIHPKDGRSRLKNTFLLNNIAALPHVIDQIHALEDTSVNGGTILLSLPLRVILSRLKEMLETDPKAVETMLFGN